MTDTERNITVTIQMPKRDGLLWSPNIEAEIDCCLLDWMVTSGRDAKSFIVGQLDTYIEELLRVYASREQPE